MKKLKLGILTMHSVIHHGSVLQAYATQHFLEKEGYDAEIIDYQYPNIWHEQRGLNVFKPGLRTKIARLLGLKPFYRGRKKIIRFQHKYYKLSKHYETPESIAKQMPIYDVYLSGSDQIWNPKFTCADSVYMFGFLPEGNRIVSFSSSFACKQLPQEFIPLYKKNLSRYDALSVRENQGKDIIQNLLGRTVSVTLDPTLMLGQNDWKRFVKDSSDNGKYIYLYMLDYAFDPKPYIYELTKYFCKKLKLKVKTNVKIPDSYEIPFVDVSDAGIEDFLSYTCNAALVITSSFHGTAFAVNFGTPLLSVVPRKGQDDRLSSLLHNLGLENCIVEIGTNFDNITPYYNKGKEQEKLSNLRKASLEYIHTALNR